MIKGMVVSSGFNIAGMTVEEYIASAPPGEEAKYIAMARDAQLDCGGRALVAMVEQLHDVVGLAWDDLADLLHSVRADIDTYPRRADRPDFRTSFP